MGRNGGEPSSTDRHTRARAVFAQMKPNEFVLLKKDEAIATCFNPLLPFHKEEVNVFKELGITVEHGQEPEESTA